MMKSLALLSLLALTPVALTADCCGDDCAVDEDGDGYTSDQDCDDSDPGINPGASEVCGDGLDQDCDGAIDEGCEPTSFDYLGRESTMLIEGVSTYGGRPVDEYGEQILVTDFSPLDEELGDRIEYFSSESLQVSMLEDTRIYALGEAYARAQDDAGYGIGEALGESSINVTFMVGVPTLVEVDAVVHGGNSVGDGGVGEAILTLRGEPGLVFTLNASPQDPESSISEQFALEPGIYSLYGSASAYVDLSGGGDAYPQGRGDFEITMGLSRL